MYFYQGNGYEKTYFICIEKYVFLRIPNLKIRIYTNVMNVIRMYLLVFWLVGLMMVNGFPDCRVYGG